MSRKKLNILIVDADAVFRSSLKTFLENNNHAVDEAGSLEDAIRLDPTSASIVIIDNKLPDATGTDILKIAGSTPVIVTCAQASLRSAVNTIKQGAADYLPKPYDFDDLLEIIKEISGTGCNPGQENNILGNSAAITEVCAQIEKVAPTDTNVLIEGESGTGKELVARRIHLLSARANQKMTVLNCAAIPDTLIESELFGHDKEAFPGASTDRAGLVEMADEGTLFLDEIGDLPLSAQGRLLHVLQDGEARRIGSVESRPVSVRLIASTHRNLQALVNRGEFREDLYYRLNVVKLKLPPLRDRNEDIGLLADYFLATANEHLGKAKLVFSESAQQRIRSYPWPGNVRELENAVQRAVILCEGGAIDPELLGVEITQASALPNFDLNNDVTSLEDYFVRFVREHQDHMTETELAKKLGISRKSLWQKRQKLGIPRERSRSK